MSSLTSILPSIAPTLNLTTQALYERQRALVRLGMLPAPQGRGRGSGAEATPDTVALLIVAVMVTDNLSDIDDRVQRLADLPFIDRRKRRTVCPWTGQSKFRDAVSYLLSPEAPGTKPRGHSNIEVSRFEPSAHITFVWSRRPGTGVSDFGELNWARSQEHLRNKAELPNRALQAIRNSLLKVWEGPKT